MAVSEKSRVFSVATLAFVAVVIAACANPFSGPGASSSPSAGSSSSPGPTASMPPPGTVGNPVFSDPEGTYSHFMRLTISDITSGATIYYTNDGSNPTTSSTKYSNPIDVGVEWEQSGGSMTIKALAVKTGMTDSAISTATYTFVYQLSAPDFNATPLSVEGNSAQPDVYPEGETITITDQDGGTIHYTLDGSIPTESSALYTTPLVVGGDGTSKTIRAISVLPHYADSDPATATFNIRYQFTWTNQIPSSPLYWSDIASSGDGSHLVTADYGADGNGGDIRTSTDYGVTWTDRPAAGTRFWTSVAISTDGTLIVAGSSGGGLWISTDGGASWTNRDPIPESGAVWLAVSSSADGNRLAALSESYGQSGVWTSSDSGSTWADRLNFQEMDSIGSLASSDDGSHLIIALLPSRGNGNSGDIFTSQDFGATWTDHGAAGARRWVSVASSSNGKYLVAAAFGDPGSGDYLFTSADYGTTWTQADSAGSRSWYSVSSSADGTRLAASDSQGYVWISSDAGQSWTAQTHLGFQFMLRMVFSQDGGFLAGIPSGFGIWTGTKPD